MRFLQEEEFSKLLVEKGLPPLSQIKSMFEDEPNRTQPVFKSPRWRELLEIFFEYYKPLKELHGNIVYETARRINSNERTKELYETLTSLLESK